MKQKWNGQKVRSLSRVKNANGKEPIEVTTELKSKIDSLTVILKSANFGNSRPQGKEKKGSRKNNTERWTMEKYIHPKYPNERKRVGTLTTGPSKGNQRPIQCYNCGGWGHGWRECLSK